VPVDGNTPEPDSAVTRYVLSINVLGAETAAAPPSLLLIPPILHDINDIVRERNVK